MRTQRKSNMNIEIFNNRYELFTAARKSMKDTCLYNPNFRADSLTEMQIFDEIEKLGDDVTILFMGKELEHSGYSFAYGYDARQYERYLGRQIDGHFTKIQEYQDKLMNLLDKV